MRTRHLIALLAVAAAAGCTPKNAAEDFRAKLTGPAGPNFHTRDVVGPEQLIGPDWSLEPTVTVYEDRYLFVIDTQGVTIPALGRNLLDLRLHEMGAIARAQQLSGAGEVVRGTTQSVKNLFKGAGILLTDPVGTIQRSGAGLERVFGDTWGSVTGKGAGLGRRKLAAQVGCDPETRNPVLKALLDKLSAQRFVGELPIQAVPYVGAFVLTKAMEDQLVSKPPFEISDDIEAELIRRGIDEDLAAAFAREKHFTTLQRLMFMEQFRPMSGLPGCDVLLTEATASTSETEALAALEITRMFSAVHREGAIVRMERLSMPLSVQAAGTHTLFLSADYVVETPALHQAVAAYRAKYPQAPCRVVCSGWVSPEAQEVFKSANIRVVENQR